MNVHSKESTAHHWSSKLTQAALSIHDEKYQITVAPVNPEMLALEGVKLVLLTNMNEERVCWWCSDSFVQTQNENVDMS